MESIKEKKRTLNAGAEDTKITALVDPKASQAEKRRLSIPCCQSDSRRKIGNKKKRTEEAGEKDTLRLQVEPFARQMKMRRLNTSRYHRVDVRLGNLVDGKIHGQQCILLLDSGSSGNWMFQSEAEKLGLLTGKEEKVTHKVLMWKGYEKMEIISLKEVEIILEGGARIKTSMDVLPKGVEGHYSMPDMIVLGLQVMHRGSMFQEFSGSGTSTAYIRELSRLHQRPRRFMGHKSLWMDVQKEGRKEPTPVLLDTGAVHFFTSMLLIQKTNSSVMPQRASLHLGDGSFLKMGLKIRPTNEREYTLGVKLLYKYDAVVDYGRSSITFKVDGKYHRVFLRHE